MSAGFTPVQDAEDLGLVLREARTTQGVTVEDLAGRSGVSTSDIHEFEAGRIIPARPPFALYMRALGFSA